MANNREAEAQRIYGSFGDLRLALSVEAFEGYRDIAQKVAEVGLAVGLGNEIVGITLKHRSGEAHPLRGKIRAVAGVVGGMGLFVAGYFDNALDLAATELDRRANYNPRTAKLVADLVARRAS